MLHLMMLDDVEPICWLRLNKYLPANRRIYILLNLYTVQYMVYLRTKYYGFLSCSNIEMNVILCVRLTRYKNRKSSAPVLLRNTPKLTRPQPVNNASNFKEI